MKFKNAWNKVYEENEVEFKTKDKNGKWVKVTKKVKMLAKPGMKPDKMEQKFTKMVQRLKPDKPKDFSGDWLK